VVKKRAGFGVTGVVFGLLAAAAFVVVAINFAGLEEWSQPSDVLPEWVRVLGYNGSLQRVRLFGIVTSFIALLGVVFGLVGRRSVVGKIALGLTSLMLVGGAGAEIASASHDYLEEKPIGSETPAAEPALDAPTLIHEPLGASPSTKHAAFRLGNRLAMATLARANGASGSALDKVQDDVRMLARELDAVVLDPPVLSGNRASDSADALHYLLDSAGKPIWRHLEARHDAQHGALFELGIKLEMLRMLHEDAEMREGLVGSIKRLAAKGGVPRAVEDLTPVAAGPSDDMSRAIDQAKERIEAGLTAKTKTPPKSAAKAQKAPAKKTQSGEAQAAEGKPGESEKVGPVSDEDRYVITVQ
jgi:hypothetical protein